MATIAAAGIGGIGQALSGWVFNNSAGLLVGLAAGVAVAIVLFAIKMFGRRLARSGDGNDWRCVIGPALAAMRPWFVGASALHAFATYSHAPGDVLRTTSFLFVIAAALQAAIFARTLILGVVERRASDEESAGLRSAMSLIRLLVTLALFAVAAILILSNLGVNVTGLIAGLGVGGIAIGLAAQGIFADLFAALAILFDRPFRKGDAIRVGTMQGTVEDIGLKSTRIRAVTGEQVILGNKQLLDKEIWNLARLHKRRIVLPFPVRPSTEGALLAKLPLAARDLVESQGASFVRCGVVGFGPDRIECELQYDVESEDPLAVFAVQHRVNVALLERFRQIGLGLGIEGAPPPKLP